LSDSAITIARALVEALAALRQAETAVNAALRLIEGEPAQVASRTGAAVRTTGVQILAVLAAHSQPLSLSEIADGVSSVRRDEDKPKRGGGTRYQELCRTSLHRLIARGLVERVEPPDKRRGGLVRFARPAS
jgi:hypothetical protein